MEKSYKVANDCQGDQPPPDQNNPKSTNANDNTVDCSTLKSSYIFSDDNVSVISNNDGGDACAYFLLPNASPLEKLTQQGSRNNNGNGSEKGQFHFDVSMDDKIFDLCGFGSYSMRFGSVANGNSNNSNNLTSGPLMAPSSLNCTVDANSTQQTTRPTQPQVLREKMACKENTVISAAPGSAKSDILASSSAATAKRSVSPESPHCSKITRYQTNNKDNYNDVVHNKGNIPPFTVPKISKRRFFSKSNNPGLTLDF